VPLDAKHRKWAVAAIMLLILGVTATLAWWRPFGTRAAYPPPIATAVLGEKAAGIGIGIYVLGKNSPSAVYAVKTSDGLVLIDTGIEPDAALVTQQLQELGLDPTRLRAILLTHVHADHVLGARRLRTATGAKTYAGKEDCPTLRAGEPRDAFLSTFHMPGVVLHATTVDVELSDGDPIDIGDTHFTAIAAPGHTPGAMCFLLERDGQRILFTGDVVQSLSDIRRALGTYSTYLAPQYLGNAVQYLSTLRKLRAMPPPDVVLPGHPRIDQVPQSPYVPAARWNGMLDSGIKAMEELLARRERDGAHFLDGKPQELRPGLDYLGDLDGFAVYCLNTPSGLLLFDAPGGPTLVEFLKDRLKQVGLGAQWPTAVLLTATDAKATAGLADFLRQSGGKVIAPSAGLDTVRAMCPAGADVISDADLPKQMWFEVKTVPLSGRGYPALAYQFRWAEKNILVSGRFPVKLSAESGEQLARDVRGSSGSARDYLNSLERLLPVRPDLWLPSTPVQAQSAVLYDDEWREIIGRNAATVGR
jgi:glyoxylase-like metal-dependent hydrolase (beta-lactamase superfamily II)